MECFCSSGYICTSCTEELNKVKKISPDEFKEYLDNYFTWASSENRTLAQHLLSIREWANDEYQCLKQRKRA